MKDLIIEESKLRPKVYFNATNGLLNIEGRSLLEYAEELFDPMNKWIEAYIKEPNKETNLNIALEYFNSSTAKALIRFLAIIKKIEHKTKLNVNFYYDDESVLEYGKDFSEIIDLNFNFIQKNYH
jgi:hypothetical protein